MTVAANTRECIADLVERKIVGVLFDACPVHRKDLARGNKTLVFEDGTGFTFSNKGSFWQESAEEIERAVRIKRRELTAVEAELRGVLDLAGAA